mgnify:CR=1 FL=1
MKVVKILTYPIRIVFVGFIKFYKFFISPILPNTCGFTPTCSQYMELAIKEFGPIKGLWIGIKRLSRCRPKGGCGFDPIPLNIKGEVKWLF